MSDEARPPSNIGIHVMDSVGDGVYCNLTAVHYAETEFTLDFLYLHPQRERGSLRARVLLHPVQARRLIDALASAVQAHDETFNPASTFGARGQEQRIMTPEDAVAIATETIEGHVEVEPTSVVHVTETPTHFIVEWQRNDPPTRRGPDYDAHVEIAKDTGEVTQFLVAS